MTDLPPDWEWATVSDLCVVNPRHFDNPLNEDDWLSIVPMPDVDAGTGVMKVSRSARYRDVRKKSLTPFQNKDVIFAKITPCMENGKIAFADGLIGGRALGSTEFFVLRSFGVIDPKYLMYFLLQSSVRRDAERNMVGAVGQRRVPRQYLESLRVPVPPLTEQRRIVAALEDLLSHLDSGRYGLKGVERRLKILARRIIVEAVPTPGPDHWKIVTVADAGKVELGRQRHPDWHTGPHMRPYLRVANVFEDRIDSSDLMEMNFPPDIFERFRLEEGDILLNEGQSPEYLGRPAMYRGSPPDVAFTNSLIRFQAGPDVLPEWALLVFRRHMHARRFIKEVRITTNIAHLSASRLKGVEFPIPPLEEQKEIVAAVHEQLDHVARMSAAVASGTTRSDHLRQALLSEAFAGRLVPQDPEDEPASVLLERIKAERAAVQAPKRRARRTGPKRVAPKSESRTRPEADTRPIVDIPAPSSTASKGTPVQETLL